MNKTGKIISAAIAYAFISLLFINCARTEKEEVEVTVPANTAEENKVVTDAKVEAERSEYRAQQEIKIKENEGRIEELKAKAETADKNMRDEYRQRINDLKAKNDELRDRMNSYRHENDRKWEDFKREFNHDMDELGNALRNFTTDNRKDKEK